MSSTWGPEPGSPRMRSPVPGPDAFTPSSRSLPGRWAGRDRAASDIRRRDPRRRGRGHPAARESIDIVYTRQVLHHVPGLTALAREVRRVLCPGGLYLACREHVTKSEAELEAFLANHQVHQLAGGEGAYPVDVYREALEAGGLRVRQVWGPLDSVINAFPLVQTQEELVEFRKHIIGPCLGRISPRVTIRLPIVGSHVMSRIEPYAPPGSMWSFLAERP